MTYNSAFDIKIPEGHNIQFEQEATFENFIGQFQRDCPKLICVINGTNLRYYDKSTQLPNNIRFDYKQRKGTLTEYYFRDINDDTLYCVFGREAATIFYPRINEIDPNGIHELSRPNTQYHKDPKIAIIGQSPNKRISGTLSRNGDSKSREFLSNYRDSVSPNAIHPPTITNNLQLDNCKPKRLPIIQPITQQTKPSMPLFRETSNNKPPLVHAIAVNNSTNMIYNQVINRDSERQNSSNQVINKDPERRNSSNYEERSRNNVIKQVILIDQGVKLTFPDPNYPIEIKAYYPS